MGVPVVTGPTVGGDDAARGRSPSIASARRSRLALVALAIGPLLAIVLVRLITTPADLAAVGGDLKVYAGYAGRLLSGAIPYRDFHLEYPPLALVPMVLPRIVTPFGPPGLETYSWLFTLQQAVLAMLGGWLIARAARSRREALAWWAVLVATASVSIAWRYDLWPAIFVLVAVIAADEGRPGAAGVAIAIGTLMKLFPIVVLPILAIRTLAAGDRAATVRLAGATVVVIGAVVGASVALAGPDALQWVWYQVDRGLQVESTGAGLLLLGHVLGGIPVTAENAFESMQLRSPGAAPLVAAAPWLELVLVTVVCAVASARFRADARSFGRVPLPTVAEATVAVIIALLVPSKVFSAQYVVWLLPLVPFLPVSRRWLALAISAISTLIYPLNYAGVWQLEAGMALVLNARNLLLVILLASLLGSLWRGRSVPTARVAAADVSSPRARRRPAARRDIGVMDVQ